MRTSHRLIKNAAFNLLGQGTALAAGLILPPFVVHEVGTEHYGLVIVATTLLQFVALVQLGTPHAMNRFVSAELQSGDASSVSRVFTNGAMLLVIAASCVGVALILLLSFPSFFVSIPEGLDVSTVRLILAILGVATLIQVLLSIGRVTFYVTEKFRTLNLIVGLGTLLRVALVFGLLLRFRGSIVAFATANATAMLVTAVVIGVIGARNLPGLRIRPGLVDRKVMGQIAGYGVEVFTNTLVMMLYVQADYFIIDRTLGPKLVTALNLAVIWGLMLRNVVGMGASVLLPSAASHQAAGDEEGVRVMFLRSTKYAFLASLVPALFLGGFRFEVIETWMGPGFESTAMILIPLLAADVLTVATTAGNDIFTGLGKVRMYMWMTLLFGVVNLVAVVLVTGFGLGGLESVALIYFGVFLLRSGIILPSWSARQLGMSPWRVYRVSYLGPLIAGAVSLPLLYALRSFVSVDGWFSLLFAGLLFVVGIAPIMFFLGLDRYDRQVLLSLLGRP